MHLQEKAFEVPFAISSETLKELEGIKTGNRDEETKYQARSVCRLLDDHEDMYEVKVTDKRMENMVLDKNISMTPDALIAAAAASFDENIEFVTDDLLCRQIANHIFGLKTFKTDKKKEDTYTGWKHVVMSDDEMAWFYGHQSENSCELLVNQYVVIENTDRQEVDVQKWDGTSMTSLYNRGTKSMYFGNIKPRDNYQKMVVDSIMTNTMTAISGKPGSGKSLFALSVAMHLIETQKYDRMVIMFNPQIARGAADIGFLPGSLQEKALGGLSVGNMLQTKFGDRFAVENLINTNKLKLVSLGQTRGMEVMDNEILILSECQNTSVDLLKLCLQRVSSGAKVIIEGDFDAQVDNIAFEGKRNGLCRAIEAFRGDHLFGHVYLPTVHRSKIAEMAEKM